jgi:type I restriction-modification system DNA methylase subunit
MHTAKELIKGTFNFPFEENRFRNFAINLLNNLDEEKSFGYISGNYIKDKFKPHITKYRRLGTYTDPNEAIIDVLVVQIKNEWALERSRSTLRNFTADYLSGRDSKDAALVAYFSSDPDDWRFSYIRMEYKLGTAESGKVTVRKDITPAKRFSFLVGKNEPNHTAQAQLLPILEDDRQNPTIGSLEAAFSVDKVTKQFYQDYRGLYEKLKKELDDIVTKDPKIEQEFEGKFLTTNNFAKKLLGQIVFLYFLQKKGWLGVGKNPDGNFEKWGQGPKNFLRRLYDREFLDYGNFFNDILEPLFYEALATERPNNVYSRFNCKIPFLNGGLFEPLNQYNWSETDIKINNSLIEEVFETFDRYNFTVREDEPLETEVAVDPEMLGKVFENLIDENERKGKGAFYTPRTIVHYMCQESLISYLVSECPDVPQADIETLIREGDIILELESAIEQGTNYQPVLMDSIKDYALGLDVALSSIKVCDPAIGSGAFPVGMLSEIVKARRVLQLYTSTKQSIYELKRHSIQHSLYGVDIDSGAIEIAKLRLWLSLIVDENDYNKIQPLPNLDYKIMQGNSVLENFHGISLDIKKRAEQSDLFKGGKALDILVDELHRKQTEYFNAEHPKDKREKRKGVESAINGIFHSELLKRKNISPFEASQIETDLYEMTHGNLVRNFFPWKLYFADAFREKGGFDVVIANPPYVRQEKFKAIKHILKDEFGQFYNGRADLYTYFYSKGVSLLNSSGTIAIISSNKFFKRGYGECTRKLLSKTIVLKQIINFGELPVFQAAVDSAIIIGQLEHTSQQEKISAVQIKKYEEIEDLVLSISENGILIDHGALTEMFWVIESRPRMEILHKMESHPTTLHKYVDGKIFGGIKTGRDEAYVITPHQRSAILEQDSNSSKLLKPWLRGKDIQKWVSPTPNYYVIYVPQSLSNLDKYPASRKHLLRHRTQLEKRATRQKWFQMQQPQENFTELFDAPKIIYCEIAKEMRACLDVSHAYGTMKMFFLPFDPYLLAILNSSLFDWYSRMRFSSLGDPWNGGRIEFKTMYMSTVPIPECTIKSRRKIEYLVNQILKVKQQTPEQDVAALECEVDNEVFELYDLTESEIVEIKEHQLLN